MDPKKKKKALSRHKKTDSFQITAKLQRRRVCGSEGRVSFASLIIFIRGMDRWTGEGFIAHFTHTHKEQGCKRLNTFFSVS